VPGKRIVVVVNKWWECDPLLSVLLNDLARPVVLGWPVELNHPRRRPVKGTPLALGAPAKYRAVFQLANVRVEIWCVSDLLEHLPDALQSSSEAKMKEMPRIVAGEGSALVIAFGTAAYPATITENGSVVVGSRVFLHDARPAGDNPDSNWKEGPFDTVLESSLDPAAFQRITTIETSPVPSVLDRFIVEPLFPASYGNLIARQDYVALSTINETDYARYKVADQTTLSAFVKHENITLARSVETTHGLVRVLSSAKFLFVSGITDRVGRFTEEVSPRAYAQNTAAAHNAAIVLAWMLPRIDAEFAEHAIGLESVPAPEVPPPPPKPGEPVAEKVIPQIDRALAVLERGGAATNAAHIREILLEARAQAMRAAQDPLGQSDALISQNELHLSLVLTALESPGSHLPQPETIEELAGTKEFEDLDPRWVATLWNNLTRTRVPFRVRQGPPTATNIANQVRFTLAGDWGTGNKSSIAIANQMRKREPHHTIHLGDVYYSGTESEEMARFVNLWAYGTASPLQAFALNSNHEMYGGGHGYFEVALADPRFAGQQQKSYFALQTDHWLICGLDSAWHASRAGLYQQGVIGPEQTEWLGVLTRQARKDRKRILLLTHHNALSTNGGKLGGLWDEIMAIVVPDVWYWGHEHAAAVHRPVSVSGVQVRARCCGHGGIPYSPMTVSPGLEWAETKLAGDNEEPRRALNGFVVLEFDGPKLVERFIDEYGNERWTAVLQ
jgi:calcineurin-like phosphoesterase family protein